MTLKISVIIPVYNAEPYIEKAVESALAQPETAEIILAEDDSPDNSLKVCRELESKYDKVRLIRHPDCKNHGAGATRTLAVKSAQFEYIAFLDADDFYLPERFNITKDIFSRYTDADGVYEATDVFFYNDEGRQKWRNSGGRDLMTMPEGILPDHLFEELVIGGKGSLHLDGLTVKKSLFLKTGYFLKNLRVHQDTAMIMQLSAFGKLLPGRLNTTVAKRGIHDQNRITAPFDRLYTRMLFWCTLFCWAENEGLSLSRQKLLFRMYILTHLVLIRNEIKNNLMRSLSQIRHFICRIAAHPVITADVIFYLIKQRAISN